jgi:hypothetical protein
MSTAKIHDTARITRAPTAKSSETIPTKDIAAIYASLKKEFIGASRSVLALTGNNLKAAVLLNQIMYWCVKNKRMYMYREQAVLGTEIGLTLKEVQGALKVLKVRGLLTTAKHRIYRIPTTHYYPDWTRIECGAFEYDQGTLEEPVKGRRIRGIDKKVIPKHHPAASSQKNDKKVIPKNDKKAIALKMTKGQFPSYSSEINYSNKPSLIEKHRNKNGSTINEGSKQHVAGSTEQQHDSADLIAPNNSATHPVQIIPAFSNGVDPPRGCWMPSKFLRAQYGVTDLTNFVVKKTHDGVDGDDGLRYMLPYLKT